MTATNKRFLEQVTDNIRQEINRSITNALQSHGWTSRIAAITGQDDASTIMQATAHEFGVTVAQLKGKSKPSNLVLARHVSMYVIRERIKPLTLSDIGKLFGGRDHTTVNYACSNVKDLMSIDKRFTQRVVRLLAIVDSERDGFEDGGGI